MESNQLSSNYCSDHGGGGVCGLRSSTSLAEIKFIIKTSILPPSSTECPSSTKKIQKLLQNGGDSSFEQSMEFKPINEQPNNIALRFSNLVDKSTDDDDQRNVIEDNNSDIEHGHDDDDAAGITECVQNHSLVTVVHPKGEDNKRLAMNSNGDVHRSNSGDVGKILKRPKLDGIDVISPTISLIKSSSSTHIAEPKTNFFGMRSFSLTPSPSLFRKNYQRGRLSGSFIREKLVLPTIVITSTPIKDSIEVDYNNERIGKNNGKKTFDKIPSLLSKENMLQASLAVGTTAVHDVEENMEFSFICEPSESECGDELMETSMTASCELQPPLEPKFVAEPHYSTNSMTNDVLKRFLGDHRRSELSAGDGRPDGADVTAFGAKKEPVIGTVEKEARDHTRRHNKENEFLVPDKSKCLNSKRVKSATVRVLHALTVSDIGAV